MSAYVYCLYSTADGLPKYVGRADDRVSHRFKQHVTAALDKEPGPLYDWIRDVWRTGHDVAVFTLQEGVDPNDHAMFERYWIDQFPDLLNEAGNQPGKVTSAVGQQVVAALQAQLALAHEKTERE